MPYQNLDAQLSEAEVQAVKAAFDTIREKLPLLVSLTPAERRSLFKAGPDSLSFVQNSLQAAQNNPGVLPGNFDQQGFGRDVALCAALTDVGTQAAQLAAQIEDTRLAVGSEAMRQATEAYTYFKTAAKNTPGMRPVVEQLAERFKKSKAKPAGSTG